MKAISLFSGAGGLDLACESVGFRTFAAVECDQVARATLFQNAKRFFPSLIPEAILEEVVGMDVADLLSRASLASGDVDLVHGGPPCTPFSKSGYWLEYKRAGADPKASLLDSYIAVLRESRPKAFLMENVHGLAYRNQNRAVLDRFRETARDAGYSFDMRVLLAADYGVPQLRQRLFCVGVREDLLDLPRDDWALSWPSPTHAGPHETRKDWDASLPPHKTASQAFGGLTEEMNPEEDEEVIVGTYASDLEAVPPGDNYLYLTKHRDHPAPRFRWRSRYWNFLLKLHPHRPSPTIQGQPGPWVGPFHCRLGRSESVDDAAPPG